MRCGISTACFYPMNTVDSLRLIAGAGVPVTEIFLNTFSEMEEDYLAGLLEVVRGSGITVSSLHPFSSMLEGFFFATAYEGRFKDGLAMYRRLFEVCRLLGAERFVFHGDNIMNKRFPFDKYAENFRILSGVAREYGVQLCHENVAYCRLGNPQNVIRLRPMLGLAAAFVLDTKQVRRATADLDEMLAAMNGDICHVHISDFTGTYDCLPPGDGDFDIPAFLEKLRGQGFDGDLIIELYRDGFENLPDLLRGMEYLNGLIG